MPSLKEYYDFVAQRGGTSKNFADWTAMLNESGAKRREYHDYLSSHGLTSKNYEDFSSWITEEGNKMSSNANYKRTQAGNKTAQAQANSPAQQVKPQGEYTPSFDMQAERESTPSYMLYADENGKPRNPDAVRDAENRKKAQAIRSKSIAQGNGGNMTFGPEAKPQDNYVEQQTMETPAEQTQRVWDESAVLAEDDRTRKAQVGNLIAPIFNKERAKREGVVNNIPNYGGLGIVRKVIEEAVNDPAKVMDAVNKQVQTPEFQQSLVDLVNERIGQEDDGEQGGQVAQLNDEEKEFAKKYFDYEYRRCAEEIQNVMYDYYKQEGATQGMLDYILGGAMRDNLISSLIQTTIEKAVGSSGLRRQIREQMAEQYGKDAGWVARGAKGMATLTADALPFMATGMAGGAIASGVKSVVSRAIGGAVARSMGYGALEGAGAIAGRYVATRPAMTFVEHLLSSGINLGLFEGMSTGAQQYRAGEFDGEQILKSMGHGALLGFATGGISGASRFASRNAGRLGKMGADAGAYIGNVSIFSAEKLWDMAQEEHKTFDGSIEDIVDYISQHADVVGENAVMFGLMELKNARNLAQRYDTDARRLGMEFTRDMAKELEDAGYGKILRKILSTLEEGRAKRADVEREGHDTIKDRVVEYGAQDEQILNEALANSKISSEAKRRLLWLVTGKVAQPSMVYGTGVSKNTDENGTYYTATTYDYREKPIENRTFKTAEEAVNWVNQFGAERLVNTTNILEQLIKAPLGNVEEAIRTVAEQYGMDINTAMKAYKDYNSFVKGNNIPSQYAEQAEQMKNFVEEVDKTANALGEANGNIAMNEVADEVLAERGINVRDIFGKMRDGKLSAEETSALDLYCDKLSQLLDRKGKTDEQKSADYRAQEEGAKLLEGEDGQLHLENLKQVKVADGMAPEMKEALDDMIGAENGAESFTRYVETLEGVDKAVAQQYWRNLNVTKGANEQAQKMVDEKVQAEEDRLKDYLKGGTMTLTDGEGNPIVDEDGQPMTVEQPVTFMVGIIDGQEVIISDVKGDTYSIVRTMEDGTQVADMVDVSAFDKDSENEPLIMTNDYQTYMDAYEQKQIDSAMAELEKKAGANPNTVTDIEVGVNFMMQDGKNVGEYIVMGQTADGKWNVAKLVPTDVDGKIQSMPSKNEGDYQILSTEEVIGKQNEYHDSQMMEQVDAEVEAMYAEAEEEGSRDGITADQTGTAVADAPETEAESTPVMVNGQPMVNAGDLRSSIEGLVGAPVQQAEPLAYTSEGRIGLDEQGEPIFDGVKDRDIARYYSENFSMEDGNALVQAQVDVRKEMLDAVKKQKPKAGKAPKVTDYLDKPNAYLRDKKAYEEEQANAQAEYEANVAKAQKELDKWNSIKAMWQKEMVADAQEAEALEVFKKENATLVEKEEALGEAESLEEYVMREAYKYQYVWGDTPKGKGMKAELFGKQDNAEMGNRLTYLNSTEGHTVRKVSELIAQSAKETGLFGQDIDDTEVFDILVDALRSYSNRTKVLEAIAENRLKKERELQRMQEEQAEQAVAEYAEGEGFEGADAFEAYIDQLNAGLLPEQAEQIESITKEYLENGNLANEPEEGAVPRVDGEAELGGSNTEGAQMGEGEQPIDNATGGRDGSEKAGVEGSGDVLGEAGAVEKESRNLGTSEGRKAEVADADAPETEAVKAPVAEKAPVRVEGDKVVGRLGEYDRDVYGEVYDEEADGYREATDEEVVETVSKMEEEYTKNVGALPEGFELMGKEEIFLKSRQGKRTDCYELGKEGRTPKEDAGYWVDIYVSEDGKTWTTGGGGLEGEIGSYMEATEFGTCEELLAEIEKAYVRSDAYDKLVESKGGNAVHVTHVARYSSRDKEQVAENTKDINDMLYDLGTGKLSEEEYVGKLMQMSNNATYPKVSAEAQKALDGLGEQERYEVLEGVNEKSEASWYGIGFKLTDEQRKAHSDLQREYMVWSRLRHRYEDNKDYDRKMQEAVTAVTEYTNELKAEHQKRVEKYNADKKKAYDALNVGDVIRVKREDGYTDTYLVKAKNGDNSVTVISQGSTVSGKKNPLELAEGKKVSAEEYKKMVDEAYDKTLAKVRERFKGDLKTATDEQIKTSIKAEKEYIKTLKKGKNPLDELTLKTMQAQIDGCEEELKRRKEESKGSKVKSKAKAKGKTKAVADATETEAKKVKTVDGKPAVIEQEDGTVEMNYRTWQEEKELVKDMLRDGGFEEDEVEAFVAGADAVAEQMQDLMEKYPVYRKMQEQEAGNRSILRDTKEYLSWDYSFNCIKKDAVNAVIDHLVAVGKSSHLGVTQIEAIKKILQRDAFLTPCVMCYVEGKRKILKQSKEIQQKWDALADALGLGEEYMGEAVELSAEQEQMLKELANGVGLERVPNYAVKSGEGIKKDTIVKEAKLMLMEPTLRGRMNYEWMMSPSAFTQMYNRFGNTGLMEFLSQGQYRGKALLESVPFSLKSIPTDLMLEMYNPVKLANIGGLRQFSYEDARAIMFFDYYTQFLVMQGAHAPEHLYTKRPFMPEMFGKTGAMMNQSLIVDVWNGADWHQKALGMDDKAYDGWLRENAGFVPRGGLAKNDARYEEGNMELVPAWSVESFPVDKAMENAHNRDFNGTVGNVVVAPSHSFIKWALDNPEVHMILAYHATGNSPIMKKLTGYDKAEPMDDGYHTLDKDGKAIDNLRADEIGLEISGKVLQWNKLLRKQGYDARKAQLVYLQYCKDNGLTPMFNYPECEIDFSGEQVSCHPEYYKMLTDFRMYDEDGKSIRQKAVKAILPDNWHEILDRYLYEEQGNANRVSSLTSNPFVMGQIENVTKYASIEKEERDTTMKLLGDIYGKDNVQVLGMEDFDKALDKYTEEGKAQMLRDNGGMVYGFTTEGKIYLSDDLFNANTPLHEHTHVYMKVLKAVNPKLYYKGMELWRGTDLWKNAEAGLEQLGEEVTEDKIFSECMSQFTGSENEKVIEKVTGITDANWLKKAVAWLKDMWDGVKSAFTKWTKKDLDGLTREEFGRMPLRAFYDEAERKAYAEKVKEMRDAGAFEKKADVEMMSEKETEIGGDDENTESDNWRMKLDDFSTMSAVGKARMDIYTNKEAIMARKEITNAVKIASEVNSGRVSSVGQGYQAFLEPLEKIADEGMESGWRNDKGWVFNAEYAKNVWELIEYPLNKYGRWLAMQAEKYPFNSAVWNVYRRAYDEVQYAIDYYRTASEGVDVTKEWDEPRFRKNDVFLSNAEVAVNGIKQEKASGEQWLNMLKKNGGLKAEEDKWIGLSDFLSGKKSVTKEEVLKYIAENKVEVQDVEYGGGNSIMKGYSHDDNGARKAVRNALIDKRGLSFADDFMDVIDVYYEEVGNSVSFGYNSDEDAEELYNKYHDESSVDLTSEDTDYEQNYFKFYDWAEHVINSVSNKSINSTRVRYTTNGLDDYREIALVVPSVEPYNSNDNIHFGDAGGGRAVAWVRFGDYTAEDGSKVLVIDEIQSKRHQDGREQGYDSDYKNSPKYKYNHARLEMSNYRADMERKYGRFFMEDDMTPEERAEYDRLLKALEDASNYDSAKVPLYNVPDAPFRKNWHELAMKRMLRYASENGYDKIAWTDGRTQAERYSLGGKVKSLSSLGTFSKYNSTKQVYIEVNHTNMELDVNKEGIVVGSEDMPEAVGKKLEEVVGKEYASKLLQDGSQTIIPSEMNIGGEGMRGFYDEMLPRYMNKYGKKWGVKVESELLEGLQDGASGYDTEIGGKIGLQMWTVPVTEEMKASVMSGQAMFTRYGGTKHNHTEAELGEMEQAVGDVAEALNTPVKVVRSEEEVDNLGGLSTSNKEILKKEGKGVFNTRTGEIVVYLPNNADKEDAVKSVLHEAVGHKGLRAMVGEKNYNDFLWKVYRDMPEEERKAINDETLKKYDGDLYEAIDEKLAEMAEKGETPTWWNKVVGAFRQLMRRLGWDVMLNENDVKYLLWQSRRRLEKGDILSEAEMRVMREKLGINSNKREGENLDTRGERSQRGRAGNGSEKDVRFRTSEELDKDYPNWNDTQTTSKGGHSTQIVGTVKSYQKIGNWILDNGLQDAKILDASSGKGLGTKAMREMGLNVDDVEPYAPEDREAPTFTSYDDIKDKYDIIVSNAVLNVIPDDWRAGVLKQMADHLAVGGKMIVNTRDLSDVKGIKNKVYLDDESEILIKNGKGGYRAYQKFYSHETLTKFIKDTLGEGYEVENATLENSGIANGQAVVVTKTSEGGGEPTSPRRTVVSKFKTAKGSARTTERGGRLGGYDFKNGKIMGNQIYVHKDYAEGVVKELMQKAEGLLPEGFTYNTVMWDKTKPNEIRFDEAPDFDTAREPIPSDMVIVDTKSNEIVPLKNGNKIRHSDFIWHHKWEWVGDDYKGFDVEESRDWSEKWYNTIENIAGIGSIKVWNKRLEDNGLPVDGKNAGDYLSLSEISSKFAEEKNSMEMYEELDRKVVIFKNENINTGEANFIISSSADDIKSELVSYGVSEKNADKHAKGIAESIEKGASALYIPSLDRILLIGTREVTVDLWHENSHRSLSQLPANEKYDVVHKLYDALHPLDKEKYQSTRTRYEKYYADKNLTAEEKEYRIKEECVVNMLGRVFNMNVIDSWIKMNTKYNGLTEEAGKLIKDIYNSIKYGKENNEGLVRIDNGGQDGVSVGESRNDNGRGGESNRGTQENDGGSMHNMWNASDGYRLSLDPYDMVARAEQMVEAERMRKEQRESAVQGIGGKISQLRKAMRQQREYDRTTVAQVVELTKDMVDAGYLSEVSASNLKRLLNSARNANGKEDIEQEVNRVIDIALTSAVKSLEGDLNKLSKVKAINVNEKGVQVQGKLDLHGQRILKEYKDSIKLSREELNARISDVGDKYTNTDDEALKAELADQMKGLYLAETYYDLLKDNAEEYVVMKNEKKDTRDQHKSGLIDAKTMNNTLREIDNSMRENREERIENLQKFIGILGGDIVEGVKKANAFLDKQTEHANEVRHYANSDLQGVSSTMHHKEGKSIKERVANNTLTRFFLQPLATFDTMLRRLGDKSPRGEGYLFNHFMRGWVEARDNELIGLKTATEELDKKASEVFGKKMLWSDLYDIEKKLAGIKVSFYDGSGDKVEYELTQGNALYMYLQSKNTDGMMKLAKMGITEEDIANVKAQIDKRLINLGEWVQDEFLVKVRNKYNAVHEEVFGAPMKAVENYFPIRILKTSLNQDKDISEADREAEKPSMTTGAIIKRVRNTKPLDILNTDALSLVIEHLQEMEHWSAFAGFNKDLSTLVSYNRFKNKVMNMQTAFGGGQKLWEQFVACAQMASGSYREKGKGTIDKLAVNLAKGATASKIALRVYTALKQTLSAPAFLDEANWGNFAKNIAMPRASWKWAYENLPIFRERVESRKAGDTRLVESESDWDMWRTKVAQLSMRYGMAPNAFVDAVTCAVGARSIYETKYKMYKDYGFSDEYADKRAKQDAEIAYNESQQSSEGAFVNNIQKDRTMGAVILSVFRNSSMAYSRKVYTALHDLRTRNAEEDIEFKTKQYMRQGLNEKQAKENAKKEHRKSYLRDALTVGIYGFVLEMLWNMAPSVPYLLLGDDDKDKQKSLKDAGTKATWGGIEGLTAGNFVSSLVDAMVNAGDEDEFKARLTNADLPELPVASDVESIIKTYQSDKLQATYDVMRMAIAMGLGFDPQTITDAVVAVDDATGGDMELGKEVMLATMRLLQVPNRGTEHYMFDDIRNADGTVNPSKLRTFAKRYVEYKQNKTMPYMDWIYSKEGRGKRVAKYIKLYDKKVKEFVGDDADELNKSMKQMQKSAPHWYEKADDQFLVEMTALKAERKQLSEIYKEATRLGKEGVKQDYDAYVKVNEKNLMRYKKLDGIISSINRCVNAYEKGYANLEDTKKRVEIGMEEARKME